VKVQLGDEPEVARITLQPVEPLNGVVTDPTGAPIQGARVLAGEERHLTDESGGFTVHGAPGDRVTVTAAGFLGASSTLSSDLARVVLTRGRPLQLRCAGITQGCSQLAVRCSSERRTTAAWCTPGPEDTQNCLCPDSPDLVVSAAGRRVDVQLDERVVWIDLRAGTGNLTARVTTTPGERCQVRASHSASEPSVVRVASCSNGTVHLQGLLPGAWDLQFSSGPVWLPDTAIGHRSARITEGETTDLGAITLEGRRP